MPFGVQNWLARIPQSKRLHSPVCRSQTQNQSGRHLKVGFSQLSKKTYTFHERWCTSFLSTQSLWSMGGVENGLRTRNGASLARVVCFGMYGGLSFSDLKGVSRYKAASAPPMLDGWAYWGRKDFQGFVHCDLGHLSIWTVQCPKSVYERHAAFASGRRFGLQAKFLKNSCFSWIFELYWNKDYKSELLTFT